MINTNFGERLKEFRKVNKLSQKDVTYCTGVTVQDISAIENNKPYKNLNDLNLLRDFMTPTEEDTRALRRFRRLKHLQEVGRRMKQLRINKNIDEAELCWLLNTNLKTLKGIENGSILITSPNKYISDIREAYFQNGIMTEEEFNNIKITRDYIPKMIYL